MQRDPEFGCCPNAAKSMTLLLVKPEHEDNVRAAVGDKNIVIKTDGSRHLGAALGSP